MSEFSSKNFAGLYPLDVVREAGNKNAVSSKIFANVVIVSEADREKVVNSTPKELIECLQERFDELEVQDILDSQLISPDAAHSALQDQPQEFLNDRAASLFAEASTLARSSTVA